MSGPTVDRIPKKMHQDSRQSHTSDLFDRLISVMMARVLHRELIIDLRQVSNHIHIGDTKLREMFSRLERLQLNLKRFCA